MWGNARPRTRPQASGMPPMGSWTAELPAPRGRVLMRSWMLLGGSLVLLLVLLVARNHWRHEVTYLMHTQDAVSIREAGVARRHRHLDTEALSKLVAARHPIARHTCGPWVERYAKLHAGILSGAELQRYAIIRYRREWENGLADRLATSLSVLLFALVSDRAFLFDFANSPSDDVLWSGLSSHFIDWRYRFSTEEGIEGIEEGNSSLVVNWNTGADGFSDPQEMIDLFTHGDLAAVGADVHSVIWLAERSVIYNSFDNPLLKSKLEELGLQRETAFACLFDFLYRPTEATVRVVEPLLPTLLDPEVLKIGVQIRVGDWQLVSGHRYFFHPDAYPNFFNHFFECARELERDAAGDSAVAVWYLITDTPALRRHLQAKFPERVLADVTGVIEHTVKSEKRSNQGFLQACAELWVFSLTDYQVVTLKSGFGKVGAAVSSPGHPHVFSISYPMQLFNAFGLGGPAFDNRKEVTLWQSARSCRRDGADSYEMICSSFTGC